MRIQLSTALVGAASLLSATASPISQTQARATCPGVQSWPSDRIWVSGPNSDWQGGVTYRTLFGIPDRVPCPKDKVTPITFTVVDLATCKSITHESHPSASPIEMTIYDLDLQKAYESGSAPLPRPFTLTCHPGADIYATVLFTQNDAPSPITPPTGYTITFG